MSHSFSSLSPDQVNNFNTHLKTLGLDPSAVHATLTTANEPLVLSSDEGKSTVQGTRVTVNDLDELKRLAGIPDEAFDKSLTEVHRSLGAPLDLSRARLSRAELDDQERQQLRDALVAYVFGRSTRVAAHKPSVEAHLFPLDVTLFAANDVVVTPGNPLIINGQLPVGTTFGTVTVEPGGQVIIETDATITIQSLVVQ